MKSNITVGRKPDMLGTMEWQQIECLLSSSAKPDLTCLQPIQPGSSSNSIRSNRTFKESFKPGLSDNLTPLAAWLLLSEERGCFLTSGQAQAMLILTVRHMPTFLKVQLETTQVWQYANLLREGIQLSKIITMRSHLRFLIMTRKYLKAFERLRKRSTERCDSQTGPRSKSHLNSRSDTT